MTDNKTLTGKQDRIRVDVNDLSEVEYIHQKFPQLNHREIVAAIKFAGPFRKDIIQYLRKQYG